MRVIEHRTEAGEPTHAAALSILRRVGRCASVLLVPALLATACERSVLDPDEEVVVTGTLQSSDGTPLSNTDVLFIRHPDAGEIVTGAITLIGSLGTACLFHPDDIELCRGVETSVTDDEGGYRFELLGADTQGTFDNAVSFTVAAATGPDEATDLSVEATFLIQTTELVVPALRFWDAAITATPDGDDTALAFHAVDDVTAGETTGYDVVLRSDEGRPWETRGLSEPEVVWTDEDVEDFSGRVHAAARSAGRAENTDISYVHRAPGPLLAGDRVPPSRGVACTVALDDQSAPLERDGVCPLTDGKLDGGYAPNGPSCTPAEGEDACDQTSDVWVALDLGATSSISHIYLRHLHLRADAALEVSVDGETFVQVAELSSGLDQVRRIDLPAPTPTRVVRVRTLDPKVKVSGLGELSVF